MTSKKDKKTEKSKPKLDKTDKLKKRGIQKRGTAEPIFDIEFEVDPVIFDEDFIG